MERTVKSKVLSLVLAIVMVFSIIPTFALSAFAADQASAKCVRKTALDLTTDAYKTESGVVNKGTVYTNEAEGWSFDSATNKLTLSGVNIRSEDKADNDARSFGIYLPDASTITLASGTTNIVRAGDTTGSDSVSFAVYVNGSLTINGTGTLKAIGGISNIGSSGIYAKLINISSGNVIADSSTSVNSFAIYSNEYLNISGGTVTATGEETGIFADGAININGATINAAGAYNGIYTFSYVNINNGLVIARCGKERLRMRRVSAINTDPMLGSGISLLTGSNTESFAVYGESGKFTVIDKNSTGSLAMFYGIGIELSSWNDSTENWGANGGYKTETIDGVKTLTLKNLIINVDISITGMNESFGIRLLDNVTINSEGTNIIHSGDTESGITSGIYNMDSSSNTTIQGEGTLLSIAGSSLTSDSSGISSLGNIFVSKGNVTAIGGTANQSFGIFSLYNTITISGGSVTAIGGKSSAYSAGIRSTGILTVSGGSVTAMSTAVGKENYGFSTGSKNINISGGTGIAISDMAATAKAFNVNPTFTNNYNFVSGASDSKIALWGYIQPKCTITWDDGTTKVTTIINAGDSITLPAEPKKENYTFGGWWDTAGGTGTQITATSAVPSSESITYYAKWTTKKAVSIDETKQTVTYNGFAQVFEIKGTDKDLDFIVSYKQDEYTTYYPSKAGTYDVVISRDEDDTYAAYSKTITGGFVIDKKPLYFNFEVRDKQYDGLNTAQTKNMSVNGLMYSDNLYWLGVKAIFSSVEVGNNIPINLSDIEVIVDNIENYSVIIPSNVTANIYNNYTAVKNTDYNTTTNDWTNSDFVIKAEDEFLLSLTNTASGSWVDSLTFSEEANGSVTFYVKSTDTKAISKAVTEVYGIDRTKPENVTVSYEKDGFKEFLNRVTFGLFFKDTVNVKFTATDSLSGVKEFKYTLDGIKQTITATNGSAELTIEPQFKGNICKIIAIDKAGNESTTVATEYFAVDSEKPNVNSVFTFGYTSDSWTKEDVTFIVSGASAESGIAKYQYSTDNGATWLDMQTTEKFDATASTPYNVTKAELKITSDTNGVSYIFRTVSNSGVESNASAATIVKIDKTAPTISVSGDTSSYKQSDNVTCTPTASFSGITKVEVKKDSGSYEDITSSYADGYKITENGTYTFKVTNGIGVSAEDSITYTKIDNVKPEVSINSNGYTENTWCNSGNITLSVSNTASNLGTTKIEYKVGNGDWQVYTSDIVVSSDCAATTYTFRATSESGIQSYEKAFVVKRDTSSPDGDIKFNDNSVKKFINTITFGLFFKENVNVTITSEDATSDIKSTEYFKSQATLTKADVEAITDWTIGTSLSISATDKEKFIIYVKVTDNAGNVTFFSSDGATFDTISPDITGITNRATYYTTQKVTVSDDNLDSFKVNGEDFVSGSTISGNIDKTYTIVATDKAGNSTTFSVTMKSIASLSATIDAITADNVKTSDKDTIQAVKNSVSGVVVDNATEAEKQSLAAITAKCDDLLAKIKATTDEISRIKTESAKYNIDTVKFSDKADLEKLVADTGILLASQNLTTDEISSLNQNIATLNTLLNTIQTTSEKIDRITKAINAYKKDRVSSTDKTVIEELVSEIDQLLATKHITDEDKTNISSLKIKADELLQQIKDAATDSNIAVKKAENISKDNVKPSDKDALAESKAAIEKALSNFEGNYTTDEAKKLKSRIDEINSALIIIANQQVVVDKINNLPTSNNVTKNDADAINDAIQAYDALTDYEKSLVDRSKLDDAIEALKNLKDDQPPQTGDSRYIPLWVALMFVSGGVFTTFKVSKKRKKTSV